MIAAEEMFNENPIMFKGRIIPLEQYVGMGAIDNKARTALIWGGTRKHHRDEYPDEEALDDLMEDLEDSFREQDADKVRDKFLAPLLAAYNRVPLERMQRVMRGEDPDEAPKGPVDQDKPARKPKPKAVKADAKANEETAA